MSSAFNVNDCFICLQRNDVSKALCKRVLDLKKGSVTSMLDHLDWESLEASRTKHRLIMFFKIVHGLVDIPSDAYLTPASTQTRSHHSLKFRQIPTSSDYYKHSFFPKTVCLWNSLPAAVAEAPDLVPFKRELTKISF